MSYKLTYWQKNWPLHKPFKISRDVHNHSETIMCEIRSGDTLGRGEAGGVSYAGETQESMLAQVESVAADIEAGVTRAKLQDLLPPGGARNALDCALWDLEAKQSGRTIWEILGWEPRSVTTVYTVGIDEPENMQKDAAAHRSFPQIKVKVGIGDPLAQIRAIRAGAPDAAIVIDANQAWDLDDLKRYTEPLKDLGVEMIEQPVAVGNDEILDGYSSALPLCADESCATTDDLERLHGLYSMVNIKLDKTGGLTEAPSTCGKSAVDGV